jgi:serine/threonine-protein kinase
VADLVLENIGSPVWVMQTILLLMALGLPVAVFFSWAYEVTPEGIKRESEIDRSQSITHVTGRKLDRAIVIMLVVALAYFAYDKFILGPQRAAELVEGMQQSATEQAKAKPEAITEPDNSIAVLPFVNMSGDEENEYFSDGLSEELLNSLSRIRELKVTGRTSSFAFKGENLDLREIGEKLNVAFVLEGSVRKADKRVRITAQLINTKDGYHHWSEAFDRELDDIFAIQQEIATHVAEAMRVTLLGEKSGSAGETRNAEAYEAYLRGNFVLQRNPDDEGILDQARTHFERALTIDPDYLSAWFGMYDYWSRRNRNGMGDLDLAKTEMQRIADRMAQIAPLSEQALLGQGRAATIGFEWANALKFLTEARNLYPGSPDTHFYFSFLQFLLADLPKSLEGAEAAVQIDPLSLLALVQQSLVNSQMGRCDEAVRIAERAFEIEPDYVRVRGAVGYCILMSGGDTDEAIRWLKDEPLAFLRLTGLAIAYQRKGDLQQAQQTKQDLDSMEGDRAAYQKAQVFAQWGNADQAIEWLVQAKNVGDAGFRYICVDRFMDPLRDDARYLELVDGAGLGECRPDRGSK